MYLSSLDSACTKTIFLFYPRVWREAKDYRCLFRWWLYLIMTRDVLGWWKKWKLMPSSVADLNKTLVWYPPKDTYILYSHTLCKQIHDYAYKIQDEDFGVAQFLFQTNTVIMKDQSKYIYSLLSARCCPNITGIFMGISRCGFYFFFIHD